MAVTTTRTGVMMLPYPSPPNPRSDHMRLTLPSAGRRGAAAVALGLAVAGLAATSTTPASAERSVPAAHVDQVSVHRGGPDARLGFHRARGGEVFLHATVSAP